MAGRVFSAASGLAALIRSGFLREPRAWAGELGRTLALLGGLGTERGAVGVEVQGLRAGRPAVGRASLLAETGAPALAVLPAAVMAPRLLAGEVPGGWVRHDSWLDRAGLEAECARRGYNLLISEPQDA